MLTSNPAGGQLSLGCAFTLKSPGESRRWLLSCLILPLCLGEFPKQTCSCDNFWCNPCVPTVGMIDTIGIVMLKGQMKFTDDYA